MELREGNFIKANVNGRSAGFIVYNGNVWLLSYTNAWDNPLLPEYGSVPNHSFFKKMRIWNNAVNTWPTFEAWRDDVLTHNQNTQAEFITSIAFPGEDGYERNIVRRRCRRNTDGQQQTTQPATQEAVSRPDIDFYLANYGTDNIYRGQNGYHASHVVGYLNQPTVPFTGHRIGIELEVEAKNAEWFNEINSKTSNWFTRERDSSLGTFGIEFISIPLLPDDAKSYQTWQPLCTYLQTRATSWNTGRCGLHVHIGREILGDNENERQMTLGKLLIFYQSDVENWVKSTAVFGRERCYHQPNGDTDEIKAVKCLGKSVLKDPEVFSKVDVAMKNEFGSSRYYAINLQNIHTIEFRKGRGSINADRIIAVITMTEAICLFAKETQPQDLTLENFQQWLFLNVPCGNPLFRYLNITQADA